MKVLVTGGAGYIGSVTVEQLVEAGNQVAVFDNLSQGHRAAVHEDAEFIVGDLANRDDVDSAITEFRPDAVMHFAAKSLVGESMQSPFLYLGDNVRNGLNLLESVVEYGIRKFILSSTANLFDDPETIPIDEKERIIPGSPYGESKHILERMLYWLDRTGKLRFAALRYFNAAGATKYRGEDHNPETHLIPLVLQVALGQRKEIKVFGNDYETPDGTCIRDYIHVADLAQAHRLALHAIDHTSHVYNLGNGLGFSVQQVLDAAREITGHAIPSEVVGRRPGDVATLVAASDNVRADLAWKPEHPEISQIIESAWKWHSDHPHGYEK
ncbi:MAG TPA: UDP-glucose 4-epimerase GalE [Planctomycetaceae bacterium]|nr:UDP-glucose 4-epimerase GalE [Planctomycetaceae bacterium]